MNKQTGGKRKEKRQQSQKQKNALKKAMQSPLQKLWKDIMKQVKTEGLSVIPGKEIFKLYDTSGFPFDSAQDIAMDAGLTIDEEGFQREMEKQRQRSKVVQTETSASASLPLIQTAANGYKPSEFIGYDSLTSESIIVDIFKDFYCFNLSFYYNGKKFILTCINHTFTLFIICVRRMGQKEGLKSQVTLLKNK